MKFSAFFTSFVIIFVAGVFIWSAFSISNNFIYIFNQIFPAAVSAPNFEIEKIIIENESEENEIMPVFASPEQDSNEAKQNLLDDIAEKLDIIQQQVNELIVQSEISELKQLEDELKNKENKEEEKQEEKTKEPETPPAEPVAKARVYNRGSAPIIYPKILISEVQIDIKSRFIKLYNPNETDVKLTNWYLQRKTETGSEYLSFVAKNDFEGKTILAKSYFLISRSLPNSDILIDDLTLTNNNFLVLKNPNREISDEMFVVYIEPVITTPIFDSGDYALPAVKIDTTPPTGTILINNGAVYTNNRNVVLTISATDDMSEIVQMKIANYNSYHDWEPYATLKNWQLPATNGTKTVRIKFKDSAGNETLVGISTTIILDTSLNLDSGDYSQ